MEPTPQELPATENEMKEIITEASEIKEQLQKSNSFSRTFLRSIISGFGTVIGATLLVAIVIYVLSLFSHIGIIGQFSDWIVDTIKNRGK